MHVNQTAHCLQSYNFAQYERTHIWSHHMESESSTLSQTNNIHYEMVNIESLKQIYYIAMWTDEPILFYVQLTFYA